MSAPVSDHSKGLILTATGGLVLTVDIPLIKLAAGDPWSILLLRSGSTVVAALVIWSIWRAMSPKAPPLVPGLPGLVVAALYAASSISFIAAVYNTPTANLVFILAFNTMFAALLSWLFLRQRPRPATLLAMAAMLVGIFIIVRDGLSAGNTFGDFMALVSAFLIACAITITRASGRDMGFAALIAVIVPFLVALAIVLPRGLQVEVPGWIILNGALVMPIAFFCLATGPKYISGPEVAMFYLLETVLAPIWVWAIFAETPSRATLAGGAVLVIALVAHSLWQIGEGRRRRAVQVPRHPM